MSNKKHYKMAPCPMCGEPINTSGQYCQSCYAYLRKHPEGLYPLPPRGVVHYAPNGDPICHVCGKAMRKLGNHIAFFHNMTQNEYREKFGLYHNTRLSNEEYQQQMNQYTNQYYGQVVEQNLIQGGIATRTNKVVLPGRNKQNKILQKVVDKIV